VSKTDKVGNPRKSRRKRLNISGGTGPEEKLILQSSDWDGIEAAYGHSVSDEDRREITGLVNKYFFWQPSESNAPFVDDAVGYLNALEKTGKHFWQTMLEREHIPNLVGEERLRGDAMIFVQNHVARYLEQFDSRKKTDWDDLVRTMGACIAAFAKTREYLTGDAADRGFVEGNAWNNFIWNLLEYAKGRQLPSGISKGDDSGNPSPFVRFVAALQNHFPPHFRRHDASPVALAEAISVARRHIKRRLAQRAAEKNNSTEQQI
jgi:hypothetical protein